jgi:RHS repeat-associated protein
VLTSTTGSNSTTYAWDFENRLTTVTLPGSGGTVTFKYDPFGRRIYKSSSTATSVYAYDGSNLVEETNATGSVVARYTQGLNIDEPLAMLRSSMTSYYEQDGLGSVSSLSNSTGALGNTYSYDSYGNLTASTGSLVNWFRFTARDFDTETNLQFSRNRYYDPNPGRFLNEDRLRFRAGVNFYRYVSNSPVNLLDPFGLLPSAKCACKIAAAAAAGGAAGAGIGRKIGGVLGGLGGGLAVGLAGFGGGELAEPAGGGVPGALAGGAAGAAEGAAAGSGIGTVAGAIIGALAGGIAADLTCSDDEPGVCLQLYQAEIAACKANSKDIMSYWTCTQKAHLNYIRCLQGQQPLRP